MSTPNVPPRPTRGSGGGSTAVKHDTPQIPPRPVRKSDPASDREAFTRSPLNEPANMNGFSRPSMPSNKLSPNDAKDRRSSSINLPSEVGQEGMEYISYDQLPAEAHGVKDTGSSAAAPERQTKEVSANVPLQHPKASVPQSTATSRIATVTRTDSTQAAAAGIGHSRPDDDVHSMPAGSGETLAPLSRVTSKTYGGEALGRVSSADQHPLRAKSSFNRSTPSLHNGARRPSSMHGADYQEGIPLIGIQSPLYPNAGDVQAPSPAQTQSQHTPGIGFFNDGSARAHHRKRSSRQEFGPPGSYGMHGHGTESHDQFEKAWLAKHPDEALKEHYSPYSLRPQSALSTEQLNKLVRENAESGFGTSPAMIGTPSQEIAFEATEQLASRYSSPKPSPLPLGEHKQPPSSGHQPPLESPLRKGSFPINERSSDTEDDHVIHVDGPLRRGSKITGGGSMDNTIDLGPTGGNTEEQGGFYDERGEGTPILASDEIMKRPGSAYLEPAVEPGMGRTDDEYYDSDHLPPSRRGSTQPPSRPSSRPNSVHGGYHGGLYRFISHEEHHGSGMHTPLEEIEEYEPLFPEGEEGQSKPKKVEKQRPGLAHHHFPSQDVWEDTPSSLQYQTFVDTPEPPREKSDAAASLQPAKVFETPEQEQARREANPEDMTSDNKTFVKPHFKPGVVEDIHSRPGVQRFPSHDIWEDTPDSMRLETTVSGPQMDEIRSPPDDQPNEDDDVSRSMPGLTQAGRPNVPSRPERRSKLAQEIKPDLPSPQSDPREKEVPDIGTDKPQLPDRTKPTIPARPARASNPDHSQGAPLANVKSPGSDGSADAPPAPKVKPAVPARPAGSKIAALQAGFMNDLNNRLKLGPAQPKVHEPEPEAEEPAAKEPLVDARKSRARGPARRKPAASPSAAPSEGALGFSMSTPMTLWHIDEKETLNVPSTTASVEGHTTEPDMAELEKVMSENEAKNTAEPALSQPSSPTDTRSSHPLADTEAKPVSHVAPEAVTADEGKPGNPAISASNEPNQKAIEKGLEAALAQAEVAPAHAEDAQQAKSVSAMGQMDDVSGRETKEDAGDVVMRAGGDETNADA